MEEQNIIFTAMVFIVIVLVARTTMCSDNDSQTEGFYKESGCLSCNCKGKGHKQVIDKELRQLLYVSGELTENTIVV
jgi:hypothetical protein